MNAGRARRARIAMFVSWALLVASIVVWPFADAGIGLVPTAFAFVPLLLPMPGLLRGFHRTLRWSPLTLAPALTMALTELLANPPARTPMMLSLVLIMAAFAAVIATLRVTPKAD